jgi:hypothetical protein
MLPSPRFSDASNELLLIPVRHAGDWVLHSNDLAEIEIDANPAEQYRRRQYRDIE